MNNEPMLWIEVLNDGAIQLTFGDQVGIVSSHHLIHPKAEQLRQAWIVKHRPEFPPPSAQ
jgi:hypothetical protein